MVPFKKLGLVGFSLLILIACEPDDPPLIDQYPEEEQLVTGTWRYDSVMVKGHSFYHATNKMIPGTNIAGLGGLRSQLDRRLVNYLPNGNYQLIWDDRGDYQLGVENTQSWQPDFGFWSFDESAMMLYHNNNLSYAIDYTVIMIDSNHMLRKYLRRMSQSSQQYGPGNLWAENEWVEYFEYFTREEQERF